MAHTKAQGSSSNGRDSHGQRLGIKRYGSQFVNAGEIIVRQRGTKFLPGTNVSRSSDDSLFARVSGIVTFEWVKRGKQQISVYPKVAETKEAKKAPAKKAPAAERHTLELIMEKSVMCDLSKFINPRSGTCGSCAPLILRFIAFCASSNPSKKSLVIFYSSLS